MSIWISVQTALRRVLATERGNSVIEYALLLALVAIVCLAAVKLIGGDTSDSLSRTASVIG